MTHPMEVGLWTASGVVAFVVLLWLLGAALPSVLTKCHYFILNRNLRHSQGFARNLIEAQLIEFATEQDVGNREAKLKELLHALRQVDPLRKRELAMVVDEVTEQFAARMKAQEPARAADCIDRLVEAFKGCRT